MQTTLLNSAIERIERHRLCTIGAGRKTFESPDEKRVGAVVALSSPPDSENSFGHPHRDILSRLAERHAAILRTHYDGLVTVRSDGRKLWLDSMLWHPGKPADIYDWALSFGRD